MTYHMKGRHAMTADYTLYLCTDSALMTARSVEECVEQAVRGGVTIVQLREKNASSRELYELAKRVKRVTDAHKVPLIINDRVDICMAVDASGVHLGQKDLPCREARRLLGRDKLIGVSAALPEEAVRAQEDGADYLGVGAVFSTATKTDTRPVTRETIAAIRRAVTIPFVVIGGVNAENITSLYGLGINGAAVVSAVAAKPDITAAAQAMLAAAKRL